MKPLCYSILLVLLCVVPAATQTNKQRAQPTNSNSSVQDESSAKEHREALEKERHLLEDQSEKYYGRIDKLIDRTIIVLGVFAALAIGLFYFAFGRTPKDLKGLVQEHIEKKVTSLFQSDIDDIKRVVEDLKIQVTDLQVSQSQSIVWVFSGSEMNAQAELDALRARGFQNIQTVIAESPTTLNIGEPDLVIFSFDGTNDGRKILERIVTSLKSESPPVSLLIYTYNSGGKEIRLDAAEREILKNFLWFVPVNFPATLVAQTQLLIRAKEKKLKV